MSQTIDQFLNLAAPGKEVFMTFDLGEVARETATMLRMSGELDERIMLRVLPEGVNAPFYGSPNQFKQVFWNLIRNSLKAMPEGAIERLDATGLPRVALHREPGPPPCRRRRRPEPGDGAVRVWW